MSRKLGERRELARQVRKRLATYLYWLQACGRDEAKAHRVLLAAQADLCRLVGLDAAASGIGGDDPSRRAIERLTGQLDESDRLLAEAGARIQAGTRTLNALAALRRSWEDQAARAAGPAAGVLLACAAQLRETVAAVHAPVRPATLSAAWDTAPGSPHEQQWPRDNGETGGLDYEAGHRVALARELTYAAECPLRDRYGFAAAGQDVLFVVDAVFREPDDAKARFLIGAANGDRIELAMPGGTITDEAYELVDCGTVHEQPVRERTGGGKDTACSGRPDRGLSGVGPAWERPARERTPRPRGRRPGLRRHPAGHAADPRRPRAGRHRDRRPDTPGRARSGRLPAPEEATGQ